jgi:ATP dependent DNA ligase domain
MSSSADKFFCFASFRSTRITVCSGLPPAMYLVPDCRMGKSAFNHSDFIFEIKWDGFRSLAVIEHRRTQLISRNCHRFVSFADLEKLISAGLSDTTAVIDGEICSLDKRGVRSSETCSFTVEIITDFSRSIC